MRVMRQILIYTLRKKFGMDVCVPHTNVADMAPVATRVPEGLSPFL